MNVVRWLCFALTTFLLTASCVAQENPSQSSKPNILLINTDDLGYGDLSCYGATKVNTPHIDRLAQQGRRFTDAHSASAVCTPSRYALLTGRYPFRAAKNLSRPVFLKEPLVINTKTSTIASVLKKAGYATACIGKWHLGFGTKGPTDWNKALKPGPLELGFDYYYGVPVVNSHPPFVYVENHHVVGLDKDDPFVYGKKAKTKEYSEKMIKAIGGADKAHALYDDEKVGTVLKNKAIEWMKGNKDKPFFLYLATTNIHHPFTPAPQFKGTSKCGPYGDFIHELDWIVGQVVATLDELKLADNTIVIFTSDNGGMLNIGGQNAWSLGHRLNGDLLGFKFDAWEGGHRVPFIVRWPGKVPAGSTSGQLVSNIDMLATLAAATGQKLTEQDGADSYNVLETFTGEPTKEVRDHLIISPFRPSNISIRKGKWMYISAQGGGGFTSKNVGSHGFGGPAAHKFTKHVNSDIENGKIKKDAPNAQLYDLESDPLQKVNVYNKYPEVVKELQALLKQNMTASRSAP